MLNDRPFMFKVRMSQEDWEHLNLIVQFENERQHKNLSDLGWIVEQTNKFAHSIASPLMFGEIPSIHEAKEKSISIHELSINGITNLEVLRKFAHLKKKTLTHIIQRYVIDHRIISEELKQIRRC